MSRVALITGGTRGIGLAIARTLGQGGARLVLTYLRNQDNARQIAAQLTEEGVQVAAIQADSGNRQDITRVMEQVQAAHGRLDIMVANGGSGFFAKLPEITDAQWRWAMDTNARALLLLAQLGAPLMEGRQGKIVAISSPGAGRVVENYAAVGAAKAAMEAMVRYLAEELGPRGINVNTVCPGMIDTAALSQLPQREMLARWVRLRTPMRRLTTPQDVAQVVAFLCSEGAAMIQGHTLMVDGGLAVRA